MNSPLQADLTPREIARKRDIQALLEKIRATKFGDTECDVLCDNVRDRYRDEIACVAPGTPEALRLASEIHTFFKTGFVDTTGEMLPFGSETQARMYSEITRILGSVEDGVTSQIIEDFLAITDAIPKENFKLGIYVRTAGIFSSPASQAERLCLKRFREMAEGDSDSYEYASINSMPGRELDLITAEFFLDRIEKNLRKRPIDFANRNSILENRLIALFFDRMQAHLSDPNIQWKDDLEKIAWQADYCDDAYNHRHCLMHLRPKDTFGYRLKAHVEGLISALDYFPEEESKKSADIRSDLQSILDAMQEDWPESPRPDELPSKVRTKEHKPA